MALQRLGYVCRSHEHLDPAAPGDPGASGTANVAGNATRKDLTAAMGTAASGAITNTAAITWTTGEVDTSEDYTHWSLFDASTAGTFLCSGTMTANAVTTGDEFTIPSGISTCPLPLLPDLIRRRPIGG